MGLPIPQSNDYGLIPATMSEAMQLAQMMATAKLVPAALQKSPADCLMIIQQAVRWQMDPFAVAQECAVIQGKLMHSGKLVAAVVNARGKLTSKLTYTYEGDGDERKIIVTGMLQGETELRGVEVKLKDAKTANTQWQKQPDQQLMYHGVRVWARRHTPELMLGVYSPEEFEDEPRLPKKDLRALYKELQDELESKTTEPSVAAWETKAADRIKLLPPDWRSTLQLCIERRMDELRAGRDLRPIGDIITDEWANRQGDNLRKAARAHEPETVDPETGEIELPPNMETAWQRLGPVKQSGVRCGDKAFWAFLAKVSGKSINDAASAVEYVRDYCGVGSRRELVPGSEAGSKWRHLDELFRAWQREPNILEETPS